MGLTLHLPIQIVTYRKYTLPTLVFLSIEAYQRVRLAIRASHLRS